MSNLLSIFTCQNLTRQNINSFNFYMNVEESLCNYQNLKMAPKDPPQPQSSISRTYLLLYNATCAALWLSILIKTVTTWFQSPDITAVYRSAEPLTRYTQTIAVVEILHAALSTYPLPQHPNLGRASTNAVWQKSLARLSLPPLLRFLLVPCRCGLSIMHSPV